MPIKISMAYWQVQLAVAALAVLLAGCDGQTREHESTVSTSSSEGYQTLEEAASAILSDPDGYIADYDATLSQLKQAGLGWTQKRDLNQDGVDEAICFPDRYAFSKSEVFNPCGATGNCPGYIFQQRNGRWHPIAEISGSDHTIEDQLLIGWAVITNTWKMGGHEYLVSVQAFESGQYRVIHSYTFMPYEVP